MLFAALLAGHACAQGLAGAQGPAGAPAPAESPGARIYRHGILPSGQLLIGKREPSLQISGKDAACVNCHRRSGLGELEGRIRIPAVDRAHLFSPLAHVAAEDDASTVDTLHAERGAYTEETLARAIRDGVAAGGRPLNYLMPHYTLGDADMATLIEYLKVMTPIKSPGVSGAVLNFATILTPDADPAKRQGMLDVLNRYFTEKNAAVAAVNPLPHSPHGGMSGFKPRWQLHVWELAGPPAAWDQQLRTRLSREPVFAVISGLGGKTWAPVHRFCEQAALPCLFPNVDLPVAAEHDFYSLYFSPGVLLEAGLIAHRLMEDKASPEPRRVVQIFRKDDIGQPAANALSAGMPGERLVDRPLGGGDVQRQLSSALRDLDARDVLVLWLRPQDLAALSGITAAKSRVVISGLMGGLEHAPLPAPWRAVATMVYPFDLPAQRIVRTDYPLGWFKLNRIPVADERVQVDTWLACGLLSETLNHMSGTFIRDYLVERLEGMLEHQVVTGYYPRLSLGSEQRFASKGGYLVRFAESSGTRIAPASDWIVP